MNSKARWQIIDVDLAFSFFAETEEGRDCFVKAIELLNHEVKVVEVRDAHHND
jgi:hypothetical protein